MVSIARARRNFAAFVRLAHIEVAKNNQSVNHVPPAIRVPKARDWMAQCLVRVLLAIIVRPVMRPVYQYHASQEHIRQLKEHRLNHANRVLKILTLIWKGRQRVDHVEPRPYQKRTLANASAWEIIECFNTVMAHVSVD